MTSFRIRPRFRELVTYSTGELQKRFEDHFAQGCDICEGMVIPGYAVLKIHSKDRHFWSPQLTLSFEETEEGTLIRGLYGPAPSVWTIFTFGYAVIAILSLFVAVIGFSQLSLDQNGNILWLLPVFMGLAAALYLSAQTGQKIGAEQMFALHHIFEGIIGERVGIK